LEVHRTAHVRRTSSPSFRMPDGLEVHRTESLDGLEVHRTESSTDWKSIALNPSTDWKSIALNPRRTGSPSH
ncbi:MAG: hypothetical protein ACKPEY_18420, partial [Planctomycetota bacterium]